MLKKVIITTTITCLLVAIIFAEPEAGKANAASTKADTPVSKQQNRAGQNKGLLKQLREAYEQKDMDKIGKMINKMEKRQKQLRAGRGSQRDNQNSPGNRALRGTQRPGRMKNQQWQGRGQRQWQSRGQGERWQGRGYRRYWQGHPASQGFAGTRGPGRWQGFAGPMRGRDCSQSRYIRRGQRQWRGRGEYGDRSFAGPMTGRRAFARGPQVRRRHRAMQRNFARQRWGGDHLNRPNVRSGFRQGPVKRFGPGDDVAVRQKRQRERSEWDW